MSATTTFESEESRALQLENDLPSLACHAAIELDNLIVGKLGELDAARRLASVLSESFPAQTDACSPGFLYDPAAVVIVNKAINESRAQGPFMHVDELVKEAGTIVGNLEQLIDDPTSFKSNRLDELQKMRTFCLALSRHASTLAQSMNDQLPDHPYRR